MERKKGLKPKDNTTRATSNARLRYRHEAVGLWRFVQVGTGRVVGRPYASERELLADVHYFCQQLDQWLRDNPA